MLKFLLSKIENVGMSNDKLCLIIIIKRVGFQCNFKFIE